MMSENVLLLERNGAIATLTLNRPDQFNALSKELNRALQESIAEIEADESVRVVILKGNGRGFCAGADLSQGIEHPVSKAIDEQYKPTMLGIAGSNKLWIAQVHGSAAGIGAALAMNCDLLTIADDATIYMAFAAISLVPDGGNTQLLLNGMGYHRALEAIVEGQKIAAKDCVQYGLVNRLYPLEELNEKTLEWAHSLSNRAPLATAAAKRLLRSVGSMTLEETIAAEGGEQDLLGQSKDFEAGVKAFFDKEKPVFKGK